MRSRNGRRALCASMRPPFFHGGNNAVWQPSAHLQRASTRPPFSMAESRFQHLRLHFWIHASMRPPFFNGGKSQPEIILFSNTYTALFERLAKIPSRTDHLLHQTTINKCISPPRALPHLRASPHRSRASSNKPVKSSFPQAAAPGSTLTKSLRPRCLAPAIRPYTARAGRKFTLKFLPCPIRTRGDRYTSVIPRARNSSRSNLPSPCCKSGLASSERTVSNPIA